MRSSFLRALLMLAALASGLAPFAHANNRADDMYLRVHNDAALRANGTTLRSDGIRVELYQWKSADEKGDLVRTQWLDAQQTHTFKFEWCASCCGNDKRRHIEIYNSRDKLLVTGKLHLKTKDANKSQMCIQDHDLTLKDQGPSDPWGYKQERDRGGKMAIIRVLQQR
jgi:hypothetical protein